VVNEENLTSCERLQLVIDDLKAEASQHKRAYEDIASKVKNLENEAGCHNALFVLANKHIAQLEQIKRAQWGPQPLPSTDANGKPNLKNFVLKHLRSMVDEPSTRGASLKMLAKAAKAQGFIEPAESSLLHVLGELSFCLRKDDRGYYSYYLGEEDKI
jgi:hypothetical protein